MLSQVTSFTPQLTVFNFEEKEVVKVKDPNANPESGLRGLHDYFYYVTCFYFCINLFYHLINGK
ncbi:MAG: hypothetical protein WDO71_23105 [Bacteroidota bacterium]